MRIRRPAYAGAMAGKGWFGLPFFSLTPRPEVVSCVLSGGGSRASFQLGALDYLYRHDDQFTPTIFVGASAGSIIASSLAQSAERPAAAPAAPVVAVADAEGQQVMIRDPRLDELLAAHKQFGSTSALQMPAGFLRNATFETPGR